MNTLGAWFQKAFPLDEKPIGGAYMEAEKTNYPYPTQLPDPELARRQSQAKQPVFAPTRDEFAAWRDDSVTQFVFACLREASAECQKLWLLQSWETGQADLQALTELRCRADAYEGMEDATYEDFCTWLGFEPEKAERAA